MILSPGKKLKKTMGSFFIKYIVHGLVLSPLIKLYEIISYDCSARPRIMCFLGPEKMCI